MAKTVHTETFSEPRNGASSVKVEIDAGDGNLVIARLASGESALASGTLQYGERQGRPTRSLTTHGGLATMTLRGGKGGQRWLRMPWSACNGATEWQVNLNPDVSIDLTAHSAGGNIKVDLAGAVATRISAETGGGNVEMVLPGGVAHLGVDANTGAGNVTVSIPSGVAARIHATTGLGKAIIDPRFGKADANTYQSPDYDSATHRIEITAKSGAGNVVVKLR